MFGVNLVMPVQICDELLRGQAEFARILSQNGQNDLEGQGQWPIFSIRDKGITRCMFVANLVIPAQICVELLRGPAKFPIILSQNGQNELEGQGQWPLFSIPTESIPWCMFGAILMILAEICDELSCGQGYVHGQTDRRRQRQYPFGLKGHGVKTLCKLVLVNWLRHSDTKWRYRSVSTLIDCTKLLLEPVVNNHKLMI